MPDLSNMAEVGTFGYIVGLTPYSSDGKQVQKEGEESCRLKKTEYRNASSKPIKNEVEEYRTHNTDHIENKHSRKTFSKKSVNKTAKKNNRQAESSDEEEREEVTKRRTKRFVKRERNLRQGIIPDLTESSENEDTPVKFKKSKVKSFLREASKASPNLTDTNLTDTSEDEEEDSQVKSRGTMKGGARHTNQEPMTYEEQLQLAILKVQERLVLDAPTPGLGNCCACAFVQQCQRPPVKLFLQSRGLTINDFMQLKKNVAEFIHANRNHPKVQNLRTNFDVSQLNMHHEGMRKRSWRQYWSDMQEDATNHMGRNWEDFWGDDIWLQAVAWYLNMDVHLIFAGANTQGRDSSDIDGNWSPVVGDRPLLYLGYIVNEHYQSLLPLVEDNSRPVYLAPPAINAVLGDVLKKLQDNQVSFKKRKFLFKEKCLGQILTGSCFRQQ